MLGKLFKKKKSPENSGDLITQSHISNLRLKKVFELELVNMEGNPCYRLNTKLGFGSEIGEVLIADDSISPRHATFSLDQDVISLIDHNSVNGTLVNNVAIEPGKSLILDENDEIKIGELLIRIKTHNEAVVREKKASLASIPISTATPEEETEESILIETVEEDESDDHELVTQLTQLDGKFQDDINLANELDDNLEGTVTSSSVLEEKGIQVEELVQPKEPDESFAVDEDVDEEVEEDVEEDEETSEKTSVFNRLLRKLNRKQKHSKSFRDRSKNAVVVQKYAANTILRIVALHIDLCLAYGTYLLVSPFDDFKDLMSMVLIEGNEFISFLAETNIYQSYEKDIFFVLEMFKDFWSLLDRYINPLPTLTIFVISKIVFTLVFGVSLGQLLVGMKASGNIIWKRVGGVLRTVIGFFTFPFLLFDIGAVISRRTFKEVITFTRIYSDSKLFNILLSLIFVPVSGLFVLMAPMFQGFEETIRYEMPSKVEERVRIQGSEEDSKEEISETFISNFLGIKIGLIDEFSVFPGFKFEGSGAKTNSQFVLNIFDEKMKGSSQIELLKRFDLKQLLEIGFKGNPFLKLKFPHIDNFIHQHTPVGFKRSVLDSESFAEEFMEFHRIAMDMSLDTYFEHIEDIPVIGSLLNYKQSFLYLFEGSAFDSMTFIKIGNTFALKVSQAGPRPHDFVIPILPEGKIYKISFIGEKASGLSSRLYRYAFYHSNWKEEFDKTSFDRILLALHGQKEIDINDAQALYGYYYELSQSVLSDFNNEEYELLRKAVKSVQLLIEGVSKEDSEALLKLDSNFKDLVDAIETQNREYFNLTDTTLL